MITIHLVSSLSRLMDAAKIEWLRSKYREVPLEGPCPKKIKLSDLHQQLEKKYFPEKVSQYAPSHIVGKAFPNAESKIADKSHTKHIIGIAPVEDVTLESSSSSTSQVNAGSIYNKISLQSYFQPSPDTHNTRSFTLSLSATATHCATYLFTQAL